MTKNNLIVNAMRNISNITKSSTTKVVYILNLHLILADLFTVAERMHTSISIYMMSLSGGFRARLKRVFASLDGLSPS